MYGRVVLYLEWVWMFFVLFLELKFCVIVVLKINIIFFEIVDYSNYKFYWMVVKINWKIIYYGDFLLFFNCLFLSKKNGRINWNKMIV